MSLTVEGMIGDLEVIYAGAYTDRESNQVVDYTDYMFVGQYLPYYICDGSVTYPGSAAPSGTCQAPYQEVDSKTTNETTSHEVRFNTPVSDSGLSATFGAFMSSSELTELNFFNYEGSQYNIGWSGVTGSAMYSTNSWSGIFSCAGSASTHTSYSLHMAGTSNERPARSARR